MNNIKIYSEKNENINENNHLIKYVKINNLMKDK